METTMKKNRAMRAAAGVMVATLVSTCAFSGVMAKYVSTDNATDTARVAKFGVVASAQGSLFGDSYNKVDDTTAPNEIRVASYNVSDESATASENDVLIVAPGTKNDDGMTFTVKGTPEVSTKLTVSAPEGVETANDDKDFANTDIFLKTGAYAVMVPVDADDVAITADNYKKFYTYASNAFTQLTDTNYKTTTGTVYTMVQMTGDSSANTNMTADYYPVEWKVNGGEAKTKVTDLQEAVATALAGAGATTDSTTKVTTVTHVPNYEYTGTATGGGQAKVTWAWDFSTATDDVWKDVTSDATLPNWENTSLADLEDTLLGDMIAQATTSSGTAGGPGDLTGYKMAKVDSGASSATEIQFKQIDAVSNSANKVYVAYTGTAPESWDKANVACLTATYGARVTVEQVD